MNAFGDSKRPEIRSLDRRTPAKYVAKQIVVVDVGNSSVKAKVYPNDDAVGRRVTQTSGDVDTVASFLSEIIQGLRTHIVIASVCDAARDTLSKRTSSSPEDRTIWFECLATDFDLVLDVDHPDRVGVDRVAAASAAFSITGGDTVVIDSGTAVTVDLVRSPRSNSNNRPIFCGGAILPGLRLQSESLAGGTSNLPTVAGLCNGVDAPASDHQMLPGRNTEAAIHSGVLAATAGGIDRIVDIYRDQVPGEVFVISSGGDALRLQSQLRCGPTQVPDLVCDGVAELVLGNSSSTNASSAEETLRADPR